MTVPKMLALVDSCGKCPKREYYSGSLYKCALAQQVIRDSSVVAPFCPLADFPSRTIAEMEMTLLAVRKSSEWGIGLAILSHIAARFKVNLNTSGSGLKIGLKDGKELYFGLERITAISVPPFEIRFRDGDSVYKMNPDTQDPEIHQLCIAEEDSTRELWAELDLA